MRVEGETVGEHPLLNPLTHGGEGGGGVGRAQDGDNSNLSAHRWTLKKVSYCDPSHKCFLSLKSSLWEVAALYCSAKCRTEQTLCLFSTILHFFSTLAHPLFLPPTLYAPQNVRCFAHRTADPPPKKKYSTAQLLLNLRNELLLSSLSLLLSCLSLCVCAHAPHFFRRTAERDPTRCHDGSKK